MVRFRSSEAAAAERSRVMATQTSSRCGFARSSSGTPTRKKTSRSLMMILSMQDRFDQDSSGLIQFQRQCFRHAHPLELLRFLIQLDLRRTNAATLVVQQNKMGVAIEFRRVNAILDQREVNRLDVQIRLLFDFTTQGRGGIFAELDFAACDAPKMRPFPG